MVRNPPGGIKHKFKMNVAEIIAALCERITQLHGVCSRLAAEKAALQRQLAQAMSATANGKQWTAEDVVTTFRIYEPDKIQTLIKALNECTGTPDNDVAGAIQKALAVLDRSSAVELLITAEHHAYATPAPPPAPGSLAAQMMETAAPAVEEPAAVPVHEEPPTKTTPEGLAVDEESQLPIKPLTEADLPRVPRKPIGSTDEEVPKDSPT